MRDRQQNQVRNNMQYGAICGWAVDFVGAARERPVWAKLLVRLALGKWAYREFIGLIDELYRNGCIPYVSYELENMEYHTDIVPLAWWKEKEPK
jgi:hypothetical protein